MGNGYEAWVSLAFWKQQQNVMFLGNGKVKENIGKLYKCQVTKRLIYHVQMIRIILRAMVSHCEFWAGINISRFVFREDHAGGGGWERTEGQLQSNCDDPKEKEWEEEIDVWENQ